MSIKTYYVVNNFLPTSAIVISYLVILPAGIR